MPIRCWNRIYSEGIRGIRFNVKTPVTGAVLPFQQRRARLHQRPGQGSVCGTGRLTCSLCRSRPKAVLQKRSLLLSPCSVQTLFLYRDDIKRTILIYPLYLQGKSGEISVVSPSFSNSPFRRKRNPVKYCVARRATLNSTGCRVKPGMTENKCRVPEFQKSTVSALPASCAFAWICLAANISWALMPWDWYSVTCRSSCLPGILPCSTHPVPR